ncbi:MAG: tetratricopeptide repeat protein [Candidatus Thiodiazotropha sp.]
MSKYNQSRRLTLLVSILIVSVALLFTKYYKQSNEPSISNVTSKISGSKPQQSNPNSSKTTTNIPYNSDELYSKLMQSVHLTEFQKILYGESSENGRNTPVEVPSEWEKIVTKKHAKTILSTDYDLMVLPLQLREPSFDRVGRMMSARWLAAEIASQTELKVMSPELSQRILGERHRRFDASAIKELAVLAGVKVIALYLDNLSIPGHVQKKAAFIAVLTNSNGMIKKMIRIPLLINTIEKPLEEVVKQTSEEIITGLLDEADIKGKSNGKVLDKKQLPYELPDSFDQLQFDKLTPVQHAAYLQLFALMTPAMLPYERDRLFERSMLALEDVDPSVAEYGLLKARALFHITRKPQALKYLKNASTQAELALQAYINGNYPDLKSHVQLIHEPILQLMGFVELKEVQHEYNIKDDYTITHSAGQTYWNNLLASLARDRDVWYAPNNFMFLSSLKGLYQEFDEYFNKSVNANIVSGEIEDTMTIGPVLQEIIHYKKPGLDAKSCCSRYADRLEVNDIWGLYRNLALANSLRKLDRSVNVHGSYGTAYDYATNLEPILTGHPTFTRLYAEAAHGLASKKTGSERTIFFEKAIALADKVASYSGAADIDALNAELVKKSIIETLPKMEETYNYSLFRLEFSDVPRSYLIMSKRFVSFTSIKALPYDHTNFNIFKYTSSSEKWSDDKLVGYLQYRYEGHPEYAAFLANRMIASDKLDQAIAILKSAIEKDSADWESHILLSKLLIKNSNYHQAEAILTNYFKVNENNLHRVSQSNRAYSAGNRFYWRGRYEEAKKFYQISGLLSTGAESGYASLQRLALMKHDYETALEYAFRRGKRYNSRYGYRDYLGILHLVGAHADALSGFTSLVSRYDSPPLWTSLLIGQRIQRNSGTQYSNIIKEILSTSSDSLKKQAARYIFLDKVTDRVPTLKDLQQMPDFEPSKSPNLLSENIIKNIAVETGVISYASKCPDNETNCVEKGGSNLQQIAKAKRNKYTKYLDAFVSYKEQDYKAAFIKYLTHNQTDPIIKIESDFKQYGEILALLHTNHRLPYLAISAAENNYAAFLQSLHKTIKNNKVDDNSDFDIFLTEAIISAFSKKIDNSVKYLKKAFNTRPHTKWRPMYSWYQITEISEWLYRYSSDKRFLNLALDWAKRYQVIQPQFAWAYAFEALYSDNRQDRIRAAGFAQYLDQESYWLSNVPVDIKKLGEHWWNTNNPFTLNQQDKTQSASI